ncbi:hypothetical protein JTE90_016744 [Oedothorax gibbosus]|uniref:Uncharacterized protein n=1 Tax=Oedothorax gibbosus TaxID=931172 RepID=A0AAV6TQX1_9ARAC|nr:hypothetical protein JTE90_016744 [Oedothorax gibbosus]
MTPFTSVPALMTSNTTSPAETQSPLTPSTSMAVTEQTAQATKSPRPVVESSNNPRSLHTTTRPRLMTVFSLSRSPSPGLTIPLQARKFHQAPNFVQPARLDHMLTPSLGISTSNSPTQEKVPESSFRKKKSTCRPHKPPLQMTLIHSVQ